MSLNFLLAESEVTDKYWHIYKARNVTTTGSVHYRYSCSDEIIAST